MGEGRGRGSPADHLAGGGRHPLWWNWAGGAPSPAGRPPSRSSRGDAQQYGFVRVRMEYSLPVLGDQGFQPDWEVTRRETIPAEVRSLNRRPRRRFRGF